MGSAIRSIAFYVAFYGGSVFYVLAAFAALLLGRGPFLFVVSGWSEWHRRCARVLLGIKVVIEGEIPHGDALVAMKHESFFEAIDLPNMFDNPVVFAKAELMRIPLWGKIGQIYGLIPVERDQGAKALRAMLKNARTQTAAGRVLVIFPEGKRVPHGTQAQMQAGFAALYKLLALPVVPIAVNSGPLYHRKWKRKGTMTFRVGEPIPPGLPRDEVEARMRAAINVLNAPAPIQD